MITTVLILGLLTFAMKAAASAFPRLPQGLLWRARLFAPGLLAALVATEVSSGDGVPQLDAKAAATAVALVLAWRGAPLGLIVAGAAAVAAALRASGVS